MSETGKKRTVAKYSELEKRKELTPYALWVLEKEIDHQRKCINNYSSIQSPSHKAMADTQMLEHSKYLSDIISAVEILKRNKKIKKK